MDANGKIAQSKSSVWCKTIVSFNVKWGSYNSFDPNPWNERMFNQSKQCGRSSFDYRG